MSDARHLPQPRFRLLHDALSAKTKIPDERSLSLLDTLIAQHLSQSKLTTLSAMQTDDASMAAALRALIEDCRDSRGTTPPLTSATVGDAILQSQLRHGIAPPPPDLETGTAYMLLPRTLLPFLPHRGRICDVWLPLGNSPFGIALARPVPIKHPRVPRAGALYTLLYPDDPAATEAFLSNPRLMHTVDTICAVTPRDYLCALTKGSTGCEVDFTMLTDGDADTLPCGYLLCASQSATAALMRTAAEHGLRMVAFARRTTTRSLCLTRAGQTVASLPLSTLNALCRPRQIEVHLHATEPPPLLPTPVLAHADGYATAALTLSLSKISNTDTLRAAIYSLKAALCVPLTNTPPVEPKKMCLAIGIDEGSALSYRNLWRALLSLSAVLREQSIPALPLAFAAQGKESTMTLALIAKGEKTPLTPLPFPNDPGETRKN